MTDAAAIAMGRGFMGYLGAGVPMRPHTTPVACVAIGLDGPITVSAGAHTVTATSVMCPARVRHEAVVERGRMLCVFVDPLIASPSATNGRFTTWTGPLGSDHRDEDKIVAATEQDGPVDWKRILELCCATDDLVPDPRISRALGAVHADPYLGAEELARGVGLSRAYFLSLFSAHSQTSLRRYRLWVRMGAAVAEIAAGHDLTRSAADAGFATPSHLSRCVTEMCGITPSELLRLKLDLHLESDFATETHDAGTNVGALSGR